MNIFRFVLFAITLCFSTAYWWSCYENGITYFVGLFFAKHDFIVKFLSLLIITVSIGLVVLAFIYWARPLLVLPALDTQIIEGEIL